MQERFSTANVAEKAGVHRDTLLRWLRKGTVPEPKRDRHGWRVFSASEADAIVAFAKGDRPIRSDTSPSVDSNAMNRLEAIEWDFTAAKTRYLTHGLHPYPAKFIPQIPNALIQELSSVGETICDIFCGSGTTLVEALQLKRHAIGIDASPLAALISQAKTTPLNQSGFEQLAAHRVACEQLLPAAEALTGNLFNDRQPFESTGWRPDRKVCDFWFLPHVVEELAELRSMVDHLSDDAVRRLCSVTFAAIIVTVSKQDSDTRYVRRDKAIEPGDTVRRYIGQLDSSIAAVQEMSDLVEERFSCEVQTANILEAPETEPFDLVVTSPPYPNAYSYHLYHRTRLIWLGYDPEHLKKIEIGSHRKYSSKSRSRATPSTFLDEFSTVFQWLRSRLRDGRHACFVIGDSTIDGRRVDNVSLLVEAGAAAGFQEVKRLQRSIAATQKAFNPSIGKIKTETILILRKV